MLHELVFIYFRHMALAGCEHFSLPVDEFLTDNFSPQFIDRDRISINRRDAESYSRAGCVVCWNLLCLNVVARYTYHWTSVLAR